MRPARLAAVVLVAVAVSGCTRGTAVTWSPQPLAVIMEPNAFRVHAASLRATAAVASLDLTPSPDLAPVLTVLPQSVANLEADVSRPVRVGIFLPATTPPGRRITGRVGGLEITIDVVPPTAAGALESLRAAVEDGHDGAYLAQFAPGLVAEQRRTLATLTDTARQALAQTLQTAERTALSGDTAEYRITLLLRGQRVESSIVLRQSSDGVWRVIRF